VSEKVRAANILLQSATDAAIQRSYRHGDFECAAWKN
jgi:hypothetical protein